MQILQKGENPLERSHAKGNGTNIEVYEYLSVHGDGRYPCLQNGGCLRTRKLSYLSYETTKLVANLLQE